MQHLRHSICRHVQKAMKVGKHFTLFFLAVAITPLVVHGNVNTGWLTNLADESGLLIDAIVPALIVGAFFLFVWGVVVFISQTGNDASRESGRNKMMWGLFGLFVLVSVWGIVAILKTMVGVPDATFVAPKATL